MIRRDVLRTDIEQRDIRWLLIVALLALFVGGLAEVVEQRRGVAQEKAPADSVVVSTQLVSSAGR